MDSLGILSVRVLLLDLEGISVIWTVNPENSPIPNASGMAEEQPGVWLAKGMSGKLLALGYLGGILATQLGSIKIPALGQRPAWTDAGILC